MTHLCSLLVWTPLMTFLMTVSSMTPWKRSSLTPRPLVRYSWMLLNLSVTKSILVVLGMLLVSRLVPSELKNKHARVLLVISLAPVPQVS